MPFLQQIYQSIQRMGLLSFGSLRSLPTVFTLMVITALLRPWHYDEGWVVLTVRNYFQEGVFSYVIDNNNAEYTFIKPWFWVLSLLQELTPNSLTFFAYRIPAIILCTLTWYACAQIVSLRTHSNDFIYGSCFLLYFSFCVYLFISARPDIAYAAFSIFVFLSYINPREQSLLHRLGFHFLIVSSGLLSASHPVGVGCYALLALGMYWHWKLGRPVIGHLIASALSFLVFIKSSLWNLSPSEFYAAYRVVSQSATHSLGFFDEWIRYKHLTEQFPDLKLIITLCLVGLALLFLSRKPSSFRSFSLQYLLISALFLAFYPAKWTYYLGLHFPIFLIGYIELILFCARSLSFLEEPYLKFRSILDTQYRLSETDKKEALS